MRASRNAVPRSLGRFPCAAQSYAESAASISCTTSPLGRAPTSVRVTSPRLKRMSVGTDRTAKRFAMCDCSSAFSYTIRRSLRSRASSAR